VNLSRRAVLHGVSQLMVKDFYMITVIEVGLFPLSNCILYGYLQRVTIPEAVVIQFVLLRMSSVLLETC